MLARDFDKFKKLMMMAQSNQDGECLAAIRKATAMLKRGGQNWQEFLDSKPVIEVIREVEVNRPIKAIADWLRQFALDIVYG